MWLKSAHQMRWVIAKQRTQAGFGFALALLIILGVIAYQATIKLIATDKQDDLIDAASAELAAISSQLVEVEDAQRGYLITSDEQYLEPYLAESPVIEQELEDLRGLIGDNPRNRQKIDMLAPLIAAKLDEIDQTNDLRERQGFAPAAQVLSTQKSQQLMADIMGLLDELKDDQDQLSQQKTAEADAKDQIINLSVTFGCFLAILLVAFMVSHGIIERRRSDAALRESAARFHRLAENALDMIYRYRMLPTPGFEYVSPAAMAITGYTPADFYADPDLVYKLIHPEDHGLIESLQRPSGSTVPLTVRWMHKDGTLIWTSQQLVPIYEPEGKLVAVEGIVRDVTERMQAYQMLELRVEDRTHEIERRRHVAEGLRDIMTILNADRPLEEVLDSIVVQACRLLETDASAVYRLDDQANVLRLRAAWGLAADAAISIPVGWGLMSQVVLTRQPLAVSDMAAALRYVAASVADSAVYAHLARLYERYSTFLAVPLVVKGEIYGAIVQYYAELRTFSREEIEVTVSFSEQAALAIENARLRAQAGQMTVVAERSRLARDLHDSVTQTLFSTSLIADALPRLWEIDRDEALRRLDELRELTRGALAEMRALLMELRPATLTEVPLSELLRRLAEAITRRKHVPVTLVVEGQARLAPDVQIALYRIAQEALNNVARHANASQAAVYLSFRPDQIELGIRDDGLGFDPTCLALEQLGLGIMRERAESIGAALRIVSGPGSGTQITITCPRASAAPEDLVEHEFALRTPALAVSGGVTYE
jgi:PAS domain S-box-containing protein